MTKVIEVKGVECPSCGHTKTGVIKAGFDMMGTRIRLRLCKTCRNQFGTAEVALPDSFNFNTTDVFKPSQDHKKYERAKKRKVIPRHNRHKNDIVRVSVSIIPGTKSSRCGTGRHLMEGENVYVNKRNGHRLCRACRIETTRAYRERNREELNRKRRARTQAKRMTKLLQEPIAA